MTKVDAERTCSQHHQPRSQCRPSDRHVRTMRFRDDDWDAAETAAWEGKSDVTGLTMLAMNAMSGYVRCYRCREDAAPVPAEMGDLTGTTLRDALFTAEKQVVAQHPRHEPVRIGTGSATARKPASPAAVPFIKPKQAAKS